ncbi:hypothetical protein HQ393_01985 [Chitinibacter bivalviorum]|uniref:Uncharacterized protein n=1 Tax=Chitinibacter bivalviorum TaxID=2739434 RepID=A0A7H9BEG4_9NEIS|nr:hypothetical protein [Chitinibacter bivalviorum]QLG87113.1 hypothetical protein HQ393_01985 [Chitinibacter bivalviorum]
MDAGDVVGEIMPEKTSSHEQRAECTTGLDISADKLDTETEEFDDVLGQSLFWLVIVTFLFSLLFFAGFLFVLILYGGFVVSIFFSIIGFVFSWYLLKFLKNKLIVTRQADLKLGRKWKLIVLFAYASVGLWFVYDQYFVTYPSFVSVVHQGRGKGIKFIYPYCNVNHNITWKDETDRLSIKGRWSNDGAVFSCVSSENQELSDDVVISSIEISSRPEIAIAYPNGMTMADRIATQDRMNFIYESNGVKVYRTSTAGNKEDQEVALFQADDGELVAVKYFINLPESKNIYRRFDKEREVEFFLRSSGEDVNFYRVFDKNAMNYLRSLVR